MNLRPLRPYQLAPVAQTIAATREAHSCLLVSPTGSGKTEMGLHVAQSLVPPDGRILWLAPSIDLVDQTVTRVRDSKVEPWILQAGERGNPDSPVIVASMHTLLAMAKRGETLPNVAVTVLDEARCHLAPQVSVIAQHFPNAYRIGLDATPARGDGRPMGDLFNRLVPGPSVRELTALGFLVPAVIRSPSERVDKLAARPVDAYVRMLRDYGDRLPGRRAIVYCRDIAHADETAASIVARGFRAEAVHQHRKKGDRRDAMARFRAGELDVLTNVMTLFQGVDIPELCGVIYARGISNEGTWLQLGGRVLRPCEGKTIGVVFDLMGAFNDFGYLDTPREWSLTGRPIRSTEPLPVAVQCRKCFAWGEGGSMCVVCQIQRDMPPPPRVRARDLIEMRRREDDADVRLRRLVGWVAGALSRGHNPWSAAHVFRGTYGEPPSGAMMREALTKAKERMAA